MGYLKAALALISIVNWVIAHLDEAKRAKAMAALWDQEFMKRDKELIDHANAIRDAASRDLANDVNRVLGHDRFERP